VPDGAKCARFTGELFKLNRDGSQSSWRCFQTPLGRYPGLQQLVPQVASAEGSRRSNSFFTTA
jgi:hypothetical protein